VIPPFTFKEPLPEGTRVEPVRLESSDRQETWAQLYRPAAPAAMVVYLAHPRVAFSRHYLVPSLLRAGIAVLGHDLRSLHNDSEAQHERLLLDVAAGVAAARARFERVALLGNSGGGTLLCAHQVGGSPRADALLVVAAHAGEGRFLVGSIDPSVTDEADPLSCDPALDMFNPANGYDLATRTARYAPEFLARYRAAQRARVERLDAAARAQVAGERAARAALAPGGDAYELLRASRRAIPHRLLVIYRTVANPAYLDLSIDPSDRDVGTIFGVLDDRPEFGNTLGTNIARVLSPRAFLSSWSVVSSKADFLALAPALDVPVLFVTARGDSEILPAGAAAMWDAIGSADRTRHDVAGADHYFRPTRRCPPARDPREELAEVVVEWLRRR
jgi:hypothetical protein